MSISSIHMIKGDYTGSDPGSVRRLQGFRKVCPPRSLGVDKYVYRFWDLAHEENKNDSSAVVFLPGAMAHGEAWFSHMLHLMDKTRCIAFSYPDVPRMELIARHLGELLQKLGVTRATLVGHSIGGIIAQYMVRQNPELVQSLVLCTSGAPSVQLPAETRKVWTGRAAMIPRLTLLPFSIIREQLAIQNFEDTCPDRYQKNMQFYRAYIEETYLTYAYKRQYLALGCRAMPAAYKKPVFAPGDLSGWNGKIVIAESEDDQMYSQEERAALRDLYPDAEIFDFGDAGQFGVYIHQERLCDKIAELLH